MTLEGPAVRLVPSFHANARPPVVPMAGQPVVELIDREALAAPVVALAPPAPSLPEVAPVPVACPVSPRRIPGGPPSCSSVPRAV